MVRSMKLAVVGLALLTHGLGCSGSGAVDPADFDAPIVPIDGVSGDSASDTKDAQVDARDDVTKDTQADTSGDVTSDINDARVDASDAITADVMDLGGPVDAGADVFDGGSDQQSNDFWVDVGVDGADVSVAIDEGSPVDAAMDVTAPPTDDGGGQEGPLLGYIDDGYYIIDYVFHEVEMDADGKIKSQVVDIIVPPQFLHVEAQISIRGDLDSFPMAFMTFTVLEEGAMTQCGSMSGFPQKPNNILDDQFRVAFPRPENLDAQSIFYPPSAPFDFQPVDCPERFEGVEITKIGMIGAFIYPPGEAGNQGPNACGGLGCTNDGRVILRFELPEDGPDFDAGSPPDVFDAVGDVGSDGGSGADVGVPDAGWQEGTLGTCPDPSSFTLSAQNPVVQLTHSGSELHHVPFPAFSAACPQNKPPFSLEFFYKLTLEDFGFVTFSVANDPAPWPIEQTWIDLLSACGSAVACGQSYQDLQGLAAPGDYIINLTQAPVGEVFLGDQSFWSFTLTAELTPMSWGEQEIISAGASLELATNGAAIATRDGSGVLHAVWVQDGFVRHGWNDQGAGGWQDAPVAMGAGVQAKNATIVSLDASTLVAAWSQQSQAGHHELVLITSQDQGITWTTPVALSEPEHDVDSVSLYAGLSSDGTPNVVVAWRDDVSQKVWKRAWLGGLWGAEGWTTSSTLEGAQGTSDHAALGGNGATVFALWEDDRSGVIQIFYSSSIDGGLTWGSDLVLGVSPSGAPDSAGQKPSVSLGQGQSVFVGYESDGVTYLAKSTDGGLSFQSLYTTGPGASSRVASHDNGAGLVAWEFFQGDPQDTSMKTVGLAFTMNGFDNAFGPFVLPNTPSTTNLVQPSVFIDPGTADVFWIDLNPATRTLMHQKLSY